MRKLLLLLLLALPAHAFADTCQKTTASPDNSGVPDGAQTYMSCDNTGELRITGTVTSTPGGGTQHVDGTGAAGTPAGGVLSVQGVAGGTSVPVSAGPIAGTTTNLSSTVTTGGTFQTISSSNAARKAIEFQNICNVAGKCTATTDICYLFFGTLGSATTSNSIVLSPGSTYLRSTGSIPSDAVNITCTTTADAFVAATE